MPWHAVKVLDFSGDCNDKTAEAVAMGFRRAAPQLKLGVNEMQIAPSLHAWGDKSHDQNWSGFGLSFSGVYTGHTYFVPL
jgi:hypothetical protein